MSSGKQDGGPNRTLEGERPRLPGGGLPSNSRGFLLYAIFSLPYPAYS